MVVARELRLEAHARRPTQWAQWLGVDHGFVTFERPGDGDWREQD